MTDPYSKQLSTDFVFECVRVRAVEQVHSHFLHICARLHFNVVWHFMLHQGSVLTSMSPRAAASTRRLSAIGLARLSSRSALI